MISIVIPIYNEADCISELLARLSKASKAWNDEYEIVFVNDASTDASLAQLKTKAGQDSHIRILSFSRNFGHQAAISAGLDVAKGNVVVLMDGDLQDPPEEIVRMLSKWREGYHVVYAVRARRSGNIFKRLSYRLFYRVLARLSDIPIPIDSGDFCLLDRRVVNVMRTELPERIRFLRGLRAFAGFKQIGIPYERPERFAGAPKYTFGALLRLALDGIFGFSLVPLRIASILGFVIAISSFLMGMFFIIHRIFGFSVFGHHASDTPGLASLAVGVFFLGGILLIILGILGEYIGRIYIEVKRRPTYIVDEVFPHG